MQRVPDPYRILGIGREATTAEVRAAHRRLAKRLHPDAPHADAARFLAVQDAYELLRDPLRRREWDRRHAQGPVRAEPSSTAARRRHPPGAEPPAGSDGQTPSPRSRRHRPPGAEATFGPNDRPPQADSWTWTAEGVPWWEDGGSPRARRTSRRRSTPGANDRPGAPASDAAAEPCGAFDAAADAPRATGTADHAADARPEFDVFSRSSGAAWSSASRAYFRRRAADMPSGAANPNTPRWTTPVGAPPPRRYDPPTHATERPTPEQPVAASRSLGAALAALFKRGDA